MADLTTRHRIATKILLSGQTINQHDLREIYDENTKTLRLVRIKNKYLQEENLPPVLNYVQFQGFPLCSDLDFMKKYNNKQFYKVVVMLNVDQIANYSWIAAKFNSILNSKIGRYLDSDRIEKYKKSASLPREHLTLLGVRTSDLAVETKLIRNHIYNYFIHTKGGKIKINLKASHLAEIGKDRYMAIHFHPNHQYHQIVKDLFQIIQNQYGSESGCQLYDGYLVPHISIGKLKPNAPKNLWMPLSPEFNLSFTLSFQKLNPEYQRDNPSRRLDIITLNKPLLETLQNNQYV